MTEGRGATAAASVPSAGTAAPSASAPRSVEGASSTAPQRETVRRLAGPFNRVEGDVEVELAIRDGQVTEAWVRAPLFRGFELILHGRDPRDALVYVPRICGICSVAQSVAAAAALQDLAGLEPAANGRHCTNLLLACENVADHLTHFYLFFMPDFAHAQYAGRSWHARAVERFAALHGTAARDVLPARARWLHITALLAGKWPHTLGVQPGGTSRPVDAAEKMRLLRLIGQFRRFVEGVLLGGPVEDFAALDGREALARWAARHPQADVSLFLHMAEDLALHEAGRGPARFISYGAYALPEGGHAFARGLWENGAAGMLDVQAIAEDASHAWLAADRAPAHPFEGATVPDADKAAAYSWCKAPRIAGRVAETGALARQVVDGHPLALDLLDERGSGSVLARVVARLLEIARLLPLMEAWVRGIDPMAPFCAHDDLPEAGRGAGLVEAARGALGHWMVVRHGRILNYQIVAPTTWNFSPRDAQGRPGPLEQALTGTRVDEHGAQSVRVQHIVRSFDPCMVCTVH